MTGTRIASGLGNPRDPAELPPPFVEGKTYLDHDGEYTVISVKGNLLEFERADGSRGTGNAEIKANIHRNILSEKGKGHLSGGARISSVDNKTARYSQSDVSPIIASVIERHSVSSKEYMEHDSIVAALIENPELRPLLDRLAEPDPKHGDISYWAANMLAGFSKGITDGSSEWDRRFERKKMNGCWAYRVCGR